MFAQHSGARFANAYLASAAHERNPAWPEACCTLWLQAITLGHSLAISGPPVIICRATVLGAKELPPTMRVLCMDLGVILVLAHDHPEAIAYSAEATVA